MIINQSSYQFDINLTFASDGIGIEQRGYSNHCTNVVIIEPEYALPFIRALLPEGWEIREKQEGGE